MVSFDVLKKTPNTVKGGHHSTKSNLQMIGEICLWGKKSECNENTLVHRPSQKNQAINYKRVWNTTNSVWKTK